MEASTRTAAHRRELQESREEILVGEVIAAMAEAGYPVIGIESDVDYQKIRFRTLGDPVLYAAVVAVDRVHTSRSFAKVVIRAESKIYLANPDELLRAYRELGANSARAGGGEIERRFNSLFATSRITVDLTRLLDGDAGRQDLQRSLFASMDASREKLAKYQTPRGAAST